MAFKRPLVPGLLVVTFLASAKALHIFSWIGLIPQMSENSF